MIVNQAPQFDPTCQRKFNDLGRRSASGPHADLQADAYSGYNTLFGPARTGGAATSALCWSHARRQFFELADIAANARRGKHAAAMSPIAMEAVETHRRVVRASDRAINGRAPMSAARPNQPESTPIIADLEAMASARARQACRAQHRSRNRSTTCSSAGIAFARFLDDGRICLTNNAAERPSADSPSAGDPALRRLRTRRRSRRRRYDAYQHGEAERRRSARLARRCAGTHRRHATVALADLLPGTGHR